MPGRPPSTTEDDHEDELAAQLAADLPASPGSLILTFESGRPCARAPFDLEATDAVTFARGEGPTRAVAAVAGPERRLTIELDDRRMSHVHAHMRRTDEGWLLEDAGSKNGTRVNGKEVTRLGLRSGDLVEVGRSFFVFREERPPGRPAEEALAALGLASARASLARQLEDLLRIARSPIAVLIQGETGTGKELVARAVHHLSGRPGPLRAVNCGALARSLLESELFGYRKGAFSGATEDRPGLIRSADKGTLFLDEIGDLALDAQAALLRVLQEGEVVPVGAVKPIAVDVRVVAATHRQLPAMVQRGQFRADLQARLAGFTLTLPPLRQRQEDLGALIATLAQRHAPAAAATAEVSAPAVRALFGYPYPGNIRELEKILATAIVLSGGKRIDLEHLPETLRVPRSLEAAAHDEGAERQRIAGLLTRHKGNVSAVAAELRTSRMQVHRLCRRFGLDLETYRTS